MQTVLETERLELVLSHPRLAREVAGFHRRNREFLRPTEGLREEGFYTEGHQRRELREFYRNARAGTGYRFWIRKKGEKPVIGMAALNEIIMGAFCSCFLAYKMDKDELRKGYAAEAAGRLVRFGFETLGLHRIEADILPWNEASLGLAAKLGFQNEGIVPRHLRVGGVWEDHVRMVRLDE